MGKFKSFAVKRPFTFGLVLFLNYALLGALTYPVHFLLPETEGGQLIGDGLGKLLITLIFLFIYWRFGWLKDSGLSRFGKIQVWMVFLPILAYKVLTWLYVFTGDLSFPIKDAGLAFSHLTLQLGTSLVEETMVRGLVLTAMLIAWGDNKAGLFKAVVLSSLYFGMIHLINLIYRPAGMVFLQAFVLTLPGILYAALALYFKTLWPGIILHWFTNASVNIKLIGVENYQETLSIWLTAAAVSLPLLLLSIYLVWKLPVEGGNDSIPESAPADS